MNTGGSEARRSGASRKTATKRMAEIRARTLASTEGPFVLVPRGFEDYDVRRVGHEDSGFEMAGIRGMFGRKEDAEFFRHARSDILTLLEALEAGQEADQEGREN